LVNPEFAAVLAFTAALLVYHILSRSRAESPNDPDGILAQLLYILTVLILFASVSMQWYFHCKYNIVETERFIPVGQMVIFSAALLLFIIRPLRPKGFTIYNPSPPAKGVIYRHNVYAHHSPWLDVPDSLVIY
jgi:hypothetical protein